MEVIVVGGFIETVELCEDNDISIFGIIDFEKKTFGNYTYLGTDDDARNIFSKSETKYVIISPDQPHLRKNLISFYENIGFESVGLVSKNAKISNYSIIGNGAFIQSNVHVSANVLIGMHVRLNYGANIMHDSIIGDYTTIAPNAVILGRVKIGKSCYIGANATILPNVEIGDNCVIGAGAVLTKSINDNQTVKGVPAK